MPNSKGETSGKALLFKQGVLTWFLSCWNWSGPDIERRDADVDDIVACLLANPEARMAVLAHFWSPEECAAVEKRAAELWQAIGEPELRRKLSEAEARLPHLEEAAELLRLHGAIHTVDDAKHWAGELGAWNSRDQALSAPTAESGKDSMPPGGSTRKGEQCNANPEVSPVAFPGRESGGAEASSPPGGAEACSNCGAYICVCGKETPSGKPPPAPVAEAPERVTVEFPELRYCERHKWASMISKGDPDPCCPECGGWSAGQTMAEAEWTRVELEQSEELRKAGSKAFVEQRDELSNLRREVEGENGLRASKEAGWSLARARLADIDALRAKLSESEAEVVELRKELKTAQREACRMHYLGNLIRQRDRAEQAELNALMRKYPPNVVGATVSDTASGIASAWKELARANSHAFLDAHRELDEAQTKLSESERKLGEFQCEFQKEQARFDSEREMLDAARKIARRFMGAAGHELPAAFRQLVVALIPAAAKEPTGVEPAKPHVHDRLTMGDSATCGECQRQRYATPPAAEAPQRHELNEHTWCTRCDRFDPGGPCPGKPSKEPPAAEAEPRFRVGQRVRNGLSPTDLGTVIEPTGPEFVVFGDHVEWDRSPGKSFYVEHRQLVAVDEPAYPAPPRPGGDRPVMVSQLVKALRRFADLQVGPVREALSNVKAARKIADELEREGSEKP